MRSEVSTKNYTELILPKLSESQKEIYDIISKYPRGINSLELSNILGKERHKFSGRLSDLVKMDLIIVDGTVKVGESTFGIWKAKVHLQEHKVDRFGQVTLF
jgi:predicted HTH transcriptional regulator